MPIETRMLGRVDYAGTVAHNAALSIRAPRLTRKA